MSSSYVHNPMSEILLYETFPDRLRKFSRETPNKEAFVFYSSVGNRTSLTCSEVYNESVKFARGLVCLGLKPGDVVGIALPNSAEWIISHFGTIIAGCISLGFTFIRKDGEDIKRPIVSSRTCKALIFSPGANDINLDVIKKFVDKTDESGNISQSQIPGLKFAITTGTVPGFPLTVEKVLQMSEEGVDELPVLQPDDVCMILQSSGTSGIPKLISRTHCDMLQMTQCLNNTTGIGNEDVFFDATSFVWLGGYCNMYLLVGCKWVTSNSNLTIGSLKDIAKRYVEIVEIEKCTSMLTMAACLYSLLEANIQLGKQFPLKAVFTGGYPLQQSIADVIGPIGKKLVIVYAGSEFGNISSKEVLSKDNLSDFNCGLPVRGNEMKVVDKHGHILERNKVGTIYVRSRRHFQGYLNDSENTAIVKKDSGWMNTEDVGYVSSNGEIIVFGRESELINGVDGGLVSPSMLESMIAKHEEVKAVSVIPIPDDKYHQKMCACIIRREGSVVTWEKLMEVLNDQIVFKKNTADMNCYVPEFHVFVDSFPLTPSGKVKKPALYEQIKNCIL